MDLRENVLARSRQRAFLARYGRQDYWKDRSIIEIESAMSAISKVLEREGEAQRTQEDM